MDIMVYVRSVYARVHEARVLKRVIIDAGDWKAQENTCHHNASALHVHDERYVPVRGWLYFDLPGLGYVKFVSHSAVRTIAHSFLSPCYRQEAATIPRRC